MRPVLAVLGTRPEAVKLAPVVFALRARGVPCKIAGTGQHRELQNDTLRELGLRPDFDLRLMPEGRDLNERAAGALKGLGALLRRVNPQLVVVQGDTTTAFMGALAAFHEGVRVAHVEAGLRTHDMRSPFPEELNRLAIDAMSNLRFAPTKRALKALGGKGLLTGNTGLDSLKRFAGKTEDGGFILFTVHRRETLGEPLTGLCKALETLLDERPELRVVWPVHQNPEVRTAAARLRGHPRAILLPPVAYKESARLLATCRFVMTDSGGLQEEAPFLGKPVLVLRRVTERPEAVEAGAALLGGVDPAKVLRLARRLLDDEALYRRMAKPRQIFGDGRSGEHVARAIAAYLKA